MFHVSLELAGRSGIPVADADSNMGGDFEFPNVPYGSYRLVVKNALGETIKIDHVVVNSTTAEMSVRVPENKTERPMDGRVSLKQLQNPPSRKAIKLVREARRMSIAGQHEKAAAKLIEVIAMSPEFAEAHTNLAAQSLHLRKYEDGLKESAKAMEIAGPNPLDLTNAAFALSGLKRYAEAEASLRTALRMDGGYPQAHLLLGQILGLSDTTLREALAHLDRAAEDIPSARPLADRIRAEVANP